MAVVRHNGCKLTSKTKKKKRFTQRLSTFQTFISMLTCITRYRRKVCYTFFQLSDQRLTICFCGLSADFLQIFCKRCRSVVTLSYSPLLVIGLIEIKKVTLAILPTIISHRQFNSFDQA